MLTRNVQLEQKFKAQKIYNSFLNERIKHSEDIIGYYTLNINHPKLNNIQNNDYVSYMFDSLKIFCLTFESIHNFKELKLYYNQFEISENIYLHKDNILDYIIPWTEGAMNQDKATGFGLSSSYLREILSFFSKKPYYPDNILQEVIDFELVSSTQIEKHKANIKPEYLYALAGFLGQTINYSFEKEIIEANPLILENPFELFSERFSNPKNVNLTTHKEHDLLLDNSSDFSKYTYHLKSLGSFIFNIYKEKNLTILESGIPYPIDFNFNYSYHKLFKDFLKPYPKLLEKFFSTINKVDIAYSYYQSLTEDKELFSLFFNKQFPKEKLTEQKVKSDIYFLNKIFTEETIHKYPEIREQYPLLLSNENEIDKYISTKELFSLEFTVNINNIFLLKFPHIKPHLYTNSSLCIFKMMQEYFLLDNKEINMIYMEKNSTNENLEYLFTSPNQADINKNYIQDIFISFINFPQIDNFFYKPNLYKDVARNLYLNKCLEITQNQKPKKNLVKSKI